MSPHSAQEQKDYITAALYIAVLLVEELFSKYCWWLCRSTDWLQPKYFSICCSSEPSRGDHLDLQGEAAFSFNATHAWKKPRTVCTKRFTALTLGQLVYILLCNYYSTVELQLSIIVIFSYFVFMIKTLSQGMALNSIFTIKTRYSSLCASVFHNCSYCLSF